MAYTLLKNRTPALLGSISALNAPLYFGVPDASNGDTHGQLTIAAAGGGVTTPTFVLEASLDSGANWFSIVNNNTDLLATGLQSGDTAVTAVVRYNVNGLRGAWFKFVLTAGTGISAMTVTALAS